MKLIRILPVSLALAALPLLSGALDVSIAAEIHLGKMRPPPPPEVIVIEEPAHHGPPPWAPAHGFRRNRAYYYYPGTDVYFRPADRMWIYLDGRNWQVGVSLPTGIRVDFERGVALTMETDKPYEFHEQVRGRYPGNYFTAKVRVKEKGGKPGKVDHEKDQHDDPAHGKNPGKGKGKGKNK